MIDQTSQFFAILTNVGAAKQANADALGIPWKIAQMAVGDANGADPVPDASQKKLINERRRAPLNQLKVDPSNSAIIIAEQVIPAEVGGFWIREIGLYDADGDLVAVANCAPSFKPLMTQGSGRTQVVRINLLVSNTSNVELRIDPTVVLATRSYVDAKVLEEIYKLDNKQSVAVATVGNIALTGLQNIDGVGLAAGDRVLVKSQTTARDNGIYVAAVGAWSRAQDADAAGEVTSALLVSVERGSTLADTRWQLITDGVIVLGTTPLMFQNVTYGFAPIDSPALVSPTANTPPQFDSSQRLQNTAFAKRMGLEFSGFAPLTASTALGASSIGGVISAASATPINITMPPVVGVPDAATLQIINASVGAVTLLAAGNDVLTSQSGAQIGVTLGLGDSAELVKVSGTWRLRGGSVALKYSTVMAGAEWTTATQFDNSRRLATTEWVRRQGKQYSGVVRINDGGTIEGAAVGSLIMLFAGADSTVRLPSVVGLPVGATLTILSYSTAVAAVSRVNTDVIFGAYPGQANSVTSMSMLYGDILELTLVNNASGSGAWYVSGGNMTASIAAPQFDNGTRLASTQYVKRAGVEWSNYNSIAVSTLLGLESVGGVISAASASAINVTMPPSARVPYGATIMVVAAGSGGVSLLPSGNDTLTNQSGFSVSIVLGQGDSALFSRVANEWRLVGGSASLKYSAAFTVPFAGVTGASGRQRLPSGALMQWVTVAVPVGQGNTAQFNWPLAFDSAVRSVAFAPDFTVSEYGYVSLVVGGRSKQGGQLLNVGQSLKFSNSPVVTIIAIGD